VLIAHLSPLGDALPAVRSFLALCTAVTLAVTAGPPPAAATPAPARPGAPGAGDPYRPAAGNGGYDVQHYDLDVRYDPATGVLTGHAVVTALATQRLSAYDLDLTGLTVDAVTVDGVPARWQRTGQELVITPRRPIADRQRYRTEVSYHGTPVGSVLDGAPSGFQRTGDGAIVAGQPDVAATWFPVNDHPTDKATYRFTVAVPQGLTAVCNGIPLGSSTAGGWTTWRWAETRPMASYLATAAIGKFRVTRGTHRGRPVFTAVGEGLPADLADDAVARTTEVADFLSTRFGPYPFDAYGAIVVDTDLGFALETQSRPVYPGGDFEAGPTDREMYLIAHETAHQWFGNSVSVRRWRDLWINEGFATYAQWLWGEHAGTGRPQDAFDFLWAQPLDQPYWAPAPADPGPDALFDPSVYYRAAMTLQALRMTIGDPAFWTLVRTWTRERAYGNGSTEDFEALAERVSGRSLGTFFDDWLRGTGRPPYPGGNPPIEPAASPLLAGR
jgi:aminopeptidase N